MVWTWHADIAWPPSEVITFWSRSLDFPNCCHASSVAPCLWFDWLLAAIVTTIIIIMAININIIITTVTVTSSSSSSCNDDVMMVISILLRRSVPKWAKIALVSPLYKTKYHMVFSNYRPISLLSIFSEILERFMYNRLLNFLNECKIMNKNQFGFRNNHAIFDNARKYKKCPW